MNFNNSPGAIGGTGAPIFDIDGKTRLEGDAWLAMLWAGPDAGSLTPWGAALTFRTGAGAGFFNTTGVDTLRTIGTVAPGAPATIQVRVWEAAGGDYFDAASGGYKFFSSAVFTVTHRRRRFASLTAGEPGWPHQLQPGSRTNHPAVVCSRGHRLDHTLPPLSHSKKSLAHGSSLN